MIQLLNVRIHALAPFVAAASLILVVAASGEPATGSAVPGCPTAGLQLLAKGQLTIGTDPHAPPPWWGGTSQAPWRMGYPPSGQGYESAVAYALAKRLGIARTSVKWAAVPVRKALARGRKPFDFYLAEVAYTPVRAKAVSFSGSYYAIDQAVVGLEARPITGVRTVAGLKPYKLGAPKGVSYAYVNQYVRPSTRTVAYDTLAYAVAALKTGEIDGLVVDFPTANAIAAEPGSHTVLVGRLRARDPRQYFGLVLERGDPLVACVNKSIDALRRDGTLARLENQWLAYAGPLLT